MYDLGDTVRLATTVHDAAGTAADATTVALTVTLPDDTTATPVVANPPAQTGRYFGDYVTTQAGLHTWRLVATDPEDAYGDVFHVRPAGSLAIISLEQAKKHLNIALETTTHDEELRNAIETTGEVVEYYTGPVAKRTVIETHSGRGRPSLVLREWPCAAIVTVHENGQLVDPAGYALDDDGLLTRVSGYSDLYWLEGRNNIEIVYKIGRLVVPRSIQEAAEELLRYNFRPQLGGNYNPFNGGSGDAGQAQRGERRLGFFVPGRVMQLLAANPSPPGMA